MNQAINPRRKNLRQAKGGPAIFIVAFLGAAVTLRAQAPGTFVPTGNMKTARISGHAATLLPNGKVLITGSGVPNAELYDPDMGTFTATGRMATDRYHHTATLLPDGRVLIAGGAYGPDTWATAELYDPSAGTFTPTGNMVTAQAWHAATLLGNSKVLITGGDIRSRSYPTAAAPELYDPSSGTFTAAGNYMYSDPFAGTWGLVATTATLLADGNVLVAAEPVAELYQPATHTFSLTGVMATPCVLGGVPIYIAGRRGTLLTNGKVLLTGGAHEDCGWFGDAEVYDPSSGRFTLIGSMTMPRTFHTATLLRDGRVLIAGGEYGPAPIVSTEFYDPVAGMFSPGPMLTRPRFFHTATLLADGRVLLAGGYTSYPADSNSDSAELYVPSLLSPTITREPSSQTVTRGNTVVFSAAAFGMPAATYQWRRDGADLPGQTSAMLVVPSADSAVAGAYSVVATNGVGTVTSATATLNVLADSNDPGRLSNVSILAALAASETMTVGTALGGDGTSGGTQLLARAVGPSLAQLGLTSFLPDPTMSLLDTSSSPAITVATNNDWNGVAALNAVFTSVGAFAFSGSSSKDAAILLPSLATGSYTVQVSDAGTGSGTVLVELYDATPTGTFTSATPRLVNISVLKAISVDTSLTVGFSIGGTTSKTVLIRAVGPALALAPFNNLTAMPDPQLTLFNSSKAVIAANNDWGGAPQVVSAASRVGAFAVTNGASRDAMLLVTLLPGLYTANVNAASGTTGGTAIVEVYEVP